MRLGGESDPRNKALMKMFNLIDIGEGDGSSVPDIFSVWEDEEHFDPDRTILTLSFEKKVEVKRPLQRYKHSIILNFMENGKEYKARTNSNDVSTNGIKLKRTLKVWI